MKRIVLLALMSAFAFTLTAVAATKIEKQARKDAKKEAKALKKEGWKTMPGALPLQRQLEDVYMKLYDKDETGQPKYYVAVAQPVAQSYDVARLQGHSLCNLNIAQQCSTQMKAIVEQAVGNKLLTPEDAVSIAEITGKSTELITKKFGRTIVLMECYKNLPNGNIQLLMRTCYPAARAMEEAKDVVRGQLEEKAQGLGQKLDGVTSK